MDCIFRFEDGSEHLAHYGVSGMKWGVWNAETTARRLGQRMRRYLGKASSTKTRAVQAMHAREVRKEKRKADRIRRIRSTRVGRVEGKAEDKVRDVQEHETMASDAKKLSGYKYHSGSLDATRTEMSSTIRAMAKKDPELQKDIDRLNHMSPYDRDHKPNKEYNATAARIGKKVCGAHFNKQAFQDVAVNEKRVVTGRR